MLEDHMTTSFSRRFVIFSLFQISILLLSVLDELVKSRKLGDSLAALPELGQGAKPGSKKLQMHGKTRESLGMRRRRTPE